MFGHIIKSTKSSLRKAVKTACQALMENFVHYNLAFQHVTQEEIIQDHTRPLAASLFGTSGKELKQYLSLTERTFTLKRVRTFIFKEDPTLYTKAGLF